MSKRILSVLLAVAGLLAQRRSQRLHKEPSPLPSRNR